MSVWTLDSRGMDGKVERNAVESEFQIQLRWSMQTPLFQRRNAEVTPSHT
jgi:hypothetical protein